MGQSSPFTENLNPSDTVCIIVSDSFRYTGIEKVLPTLLDQLLQSGIQPENISFLFATGSHRGPTPDEAEEILGSDIYNTFKDRAYTHHPDNTEEMLLLGTTQRGTPVEINRKAIECNKLIVTGTVVMHYFGGFGGGRKAILPGIASTKSIANNHSLNIHPTENKRNPDVQIGRMQGNPVAEDMLEGAKMCKVDLLINTVLNQSGEIAGIFTGDLETAHKEACNFAAKLYTAPVQKQADIVIASAGKARNFIQSHKAMFNAYQAMKPGGFLILAAPAPEGLGGERFKHWLGLGSVDAIFEELRANAEINGQTALSVLEKAPATLLLTDISPEEVQRIGAQHPTTLQNALDHAIQSLDSRNISRPDVYLMPNAGYSVPQIS